MNTKTSVLLTSIAILVVSCATGPTPEELRQIEVRNHRRSEELARIEAERRAFEQQRQKEIQGGTTTLQLAPSAVSEINSSILKLRKAWVEKAETAAAKFPFDFDLSKGLLSVSSADGVYTFYMPDIDYVHLEPYQREHRAPNGVTMSQVNYSIAFATYYSKSDPGNKRFSVIRQGQITGSGTWESEIKLFLYSVDSKAGLGVETSPPIYGNLYDIFGVVKKSRPNQ